MNVFTRKYRVHLTFSSVLVYIIVSLTKDLALIQIRPPFKTNGRIKPIPINDVYQDLKGQSALISGWGRNENGRLQKQLQKTSVTISNYINRPPGQFKRFWGRYMALWSPNGKGANKGDSGGNNYLTKRWHDYDDDAFFLNSTYK